MLEATETEVTVVVQTPAPEPTAVVPPSSSVAGETATVVIPELVSLAAAVGTLTAEVSALKEQTAAAQSAAESAARTADVALTEAARSPEPEPEPEVSAVTEVEVPSSAVVDDPAKTPATARPWLARVLLG